LESVAAEFPVAEVMMLGNGKMLTMFWFGLVVMLAIELFLNKERISASLKRMKAVGRGMSQDYFLKPYLSDAESASESSDEGSSDSDSD
jgi:hypothetical protein